MTANLRCLSKACIASLGMTKHSTLHVVMIYIEERSSPTPKKSPRSRLPGDSDNELVEKLIILLKIAHIQPKSLVKTQKNSNSVSILLTSKSKCLTSFGTFLKDQLKVLFRKTNSRLGCTVHLTNTNNCMSNQFYRKTDNGLQQMWSIQRSKS